MSVYLIGVSIGQQRKPVYKPGVARRINSDVLRLTQCKVQYGKQSAVYCSVLHKIGLVLYMTGYVLNISGSVLYITEYPKYD